MAFVNKSKKILLLLAIFSYTAFGSLDCGGKAFLCVNSTHFNICVDFGNGVSSTVDNFILPCPPGTECRSTNRFECEIYAPTIPAAIDSMNDAMNDGKAKEERSVSTTPMWEAVTTNVPVPSYHDAQYSEKYLNTENSRFFTNSATFGPLDLSTTVSPESNVLSEVRTFSVPPSKETVSDKDKSPSFNVITIAPFSVNPILENEGPVEYILTSATTTQSTASPARPISNSYTPTRQIPQEVSLNHYEMTELSVSKTTAQDHISVSEITTDETTADIIALMSSTEKASAYDKLSIAENNRAKETIDDSMVTESATKEAFEKIFTATGSTTKDYAKNNTTSTERAFKEIIQDKTTFSEIGTVQDIATSTESETMVTIQDNTSYVENINIQGTTNSIDSTIKETMRNITTSSDNIADTIIQSTKIPPESTNFWDTTTGSDTVTINTLIENATIQKITTSPESLSFQDTMNFTESVIIQDNTSAQESSTIYNPMISTVSLSIQSTTTSPERVTFPDSTIFLESTTVQSTKASAESVIQETIQDTITFAKSVAHIQNIKTSPKSATYHNIQSSTESVVLENAPNENTKNIATTETILDITTEDTSIVTYSPTERIDSKLMLDEFNLVNTEQQNSSPPSEWGILTIDSPIVISTDAPELKMPASESKSTVSELVPTFWSESDVAIRPAIIPSDEMNLFSKSVSNIPLVSTENYKTSEADNTANIMQESSTKTYTDSEFYDTKQPLQLLTDKLKIENKPPVFEITTGNTILTPSINNVDTVSELMIKDETVGQESYTKSYAALEFNDTTQPSAVFENKEHSQQKEAAADIIKIDVDLKTDLAIEIMTSRTVENDKEKVAVHELKTERNKVPEFYHSTQSLASEIPTEEQKTDRQSSIFQTTENIQQNAITEMIFNVEISSQNPLKNVLLNEENKPQDVVFGTASNKTDNDDKGITIVVEDRAQSVRELQNIMTKTVVEVTNSNNYEEAVNLPTTLNIASKNEDVLKNDLHDSRHSQSKTIKSPDSAVVLISNTVSPPSDTPTTLSKENVFEQPIYKEFTTLKTVNEVSNIPLSVVIEDEQVFQAGTTPDTKNTFSNTDDVIGDNFPWLGPKEQGIVESSDPIKTIEARLDDGVTEPTIKVTADSIVITDAAHTYTVKVSVDKIINNKQIDENSNLPSKLSEPLSKREQVNSVADTIPETTPSYMVKATVDQSNVNNNEIINISNEPRETKKTEVIHQHGSTFSDHSTVDIEVTTIPVQKSPAIVKTITEKGTPNHYTIGQIEGSSKSQFADQHTEVSMTPATTFATIAITTPASITNEENTVSSSKLSFAPNGDVANMEVTTPVSLVSNSVLTNRDNKELSKILISPMQTAEVKKTTIISTGEKIITEESTTDSEPKQIRQFVFSEEKLEDNRILTTTAITETFPTAAVSVRNNVLSPSEVNPDISTSSISASTDSVYEIRNISSTSVNLASLGIGANEDIKKSVGTVSTQQVDYNVLAIPPTTTESSVERSEVTTSSTGIKVSKFVDYPTSHNAISNARMSTTTENIINANIKTMTKSPATEVNEDPTLRVAVLTTQPEIKVPTSIKVTYGPIIVTNPSLSTGGIIISEVIPAKGTTSTGLDTNTNGLTSAGRIGVPNEVIEVKSITSSVIASPVNFKGHISESRTAIKDTNLVNPNSETYGRVESVLNTSLIKPSTGKENQTTPTTFNTDNAAIEKTKNETHAEGRSKNYTTTNPAVVNSKADSTTINPAVIKTVTSKVNENMQTLRPIVKTPLVAKSKFDCTNLSRGRYSDEVDCRKFYICIDKPHPVVGHCPVNTVFSEIKRQCVRNLSHCIRGNEFKCAAPGRFVDSNRENIYYLCIRSANLFLRFKFQCQNGYTLDRIDVRCKQNVESENESHSTSESHSSKKSSNDNGSGENEFICKKAGNFPHQSDCRKYYICYKTKKSGLKRKVGKCDSDEVFNPDKKKCVDDDSYECQL